MLHSTSIPSIPESGKAWDATISAHFNTFYYLGKFQQNLAPKVFPKDGAMTNSLQPRLGNGMVTKAFSLARNVRIVTLHLSVVVPTRHPKWSHFVWEESGPKISSSPSPNEKYNSQFLALGSYHLISLALLLVKDMAGSIKLSDRWGDFSSRFQPDLDPTSSKVHQVQPPYRRGPTK